jgi:predicted phosphoribosyltransferase
MDMALYRDRRDAGETLADALEHLRGTPDLLVLGLPRGGVPVAEPVARRLGAPLDVFVVRKIGYPGQEELAMGAAASGGVVLASPALSEGVSAETFRAAVERALRELDDRERAYRGIRPPEPVAGRTIVLVDDGLATGASMLAAVEALRRLGPERIVGAVPVAPPDTCAALAREVDQVICAATPEPFVGVGRWYDDFSPTSDEEVQRILAAAGAGEASGASPGA